RFTQEFLLLKFLNCIAERAWIFWFHIKATPGPSQNLPGLAIYRQYDRTTARHELQHLRGNDGLEHTRFSEQNQACIRRRNVSRDFLSLLLRHEANIRSEERRVGKEWRSGWCEAQE